MARCLLRCCKLPELVPCSASVWSHLLGLGAQAPPGCSLCRLSPSTKAAASCGQTPFQYIHTPRLASPARTLQDLACGLFELRDEAALRAAERALVDGNGALHQGAGDSDSSDDDSSDDEDDDEEDAHMDAEGVQGQGTAAAAGTSRAAGRGAAGASGSGSGKGRSSGMEVDGAEGGADAGGSGGQGGKRAKLKAKRNPKIVELGP